MHTDSCCLSVCELVRLMSGSLLDVSLTPFIHSSWRRVPLLLHVRTGDSCDQLALSVTAPVTPVSVSAAAAAVPNCKTSRPNTPICRLAYHDGFCNNRIFASGSTDGSATWNKRKTQCSYMWRNVHFRCDVTSVQFSNISLSIVTRHVPTLGSSILLVCI